MSRCHSSRACGTDEAARVTLTAPFARVVVFVLTGPVELTKSKASAPTTLTNAISEPGNETSSVYWGP